MLQFVRLTKFSIKWLISSKIAGRYAQYESG